jgi:hypothetical protein
MLTKNSFLILLIAVILIIVLFSNLNLTKSQTINCSPADLTTSGLTYGSVNSNLKNFNSCLNLLNFRFGEITDKYDDDTRNAVKRFYIQVLNYDPLDSQLDLLSLAFNNNNLELLKAMAKKKIDLENAYDLTNQLKSYELPENYRFLNSLVVDDNLKKVLVSYINSVNKNSIYQINLDSGKYSSISKNYDLISDIGFMNGYPYFKYSYKGKNYLAIYSSSTNTSTNKYLVYGPYDYIQDFKIYDNGDLVILYSKNTFIYTTIGNLNSGIIKIGPFNNTYNFQFSPFEAKIGFVSLDPLALERIGQAVGQYLGLVSKNYFPEVISGFSFIDNFNFAQVNSSSTVIPGYVFSFKPLWQSISDPNLINDFMSDWLYVSGESFCKNYNDFIEIFNRANRQHATLINLISQLKNNNNCKIITNSSTPINQDYLETVISSSTVNLKDIDRQTKGPLSICGPYNRIYKIYLSPDKRKIIISYVKNSLAGINKGIAGLNLTKILINQGCNININLIQFSPDCQLDVNSYIAGCLPDLFKLVSAQSSAAADFYSPIDFDDDLGIIFSQEGNKFAFFYRKYDQYNVNIYVYPSVSESKKNLPIATFSNFVEPIEKFAFSPNGEFYVFLGKEEDINTGEIIKTIYLGGQNKNPKKFSDIDEVGDFVFDEENNKLVFWYSLKKDSNKYLKIIDLPSMSEEDIGPFFNNFEIEKIVLADNGSKYALILRENYNKKYLFYNNKFFKMPFNSIVNFLRIKNNNELYYKLLVIFIKGKTIYLVTPDIDVTNYELQKIINTF